MYIHCNIVNHKVNSKQCALQSFKELIKSFEERGVQKSVFQDYLKTNHIAGSNNYAKIFH